MTPLPDREAEWLEADGLGGYASGTVGLARTRRYHALLLAATTPPTGRMALVNGLDATLETSGGAFALSAQHYAPGVTRPDGFGHVASFSPEPWPTWGFRLPDGTRIEHELFTPHGRPAVALRWRRTAGSGRAALHVRPFLSGRDYHCLHQENPAFHFKPRPGRDGLSWHPYEGVPGILALFNGGYAHQPGWYRQFFYPRECQRGLDHVEDLAAPGVITFDLAAGDALLLLSAEELPGAVTEAEGPVATVFHRLREGESARRGGLPGRAERSADAYFVRREDGWTIVAGYPWFTDWGRDTFISLRGLCLATGRLDLARSILLAWAGHVSEGMLPNRFPDRGAPEYGSVDASLWYVIAVFDYLERTRAAGRDVAEEEAALRRAVLDILAGYTRGTRYRIGVDADGLVRAGVPGMQLTWMDVKIGDRVVTPRTGKPVEVQALWLNALKLASRWDPALRPRFEQGRRSFRKRFWNEEEGHLCDVVDVDHRPGAFDVSLRPNQVLAIGGLPVPLIKGRKARRVLRAVEAYLLTPMGLRTLAPGEPGYRGRYEGGPLERDGAYHMGTVWPWLMGPFVQAWLRVHGDDARTRRQARERFLPALLRHLDEDGLGHVSEIANGDPPHTAFGCPFQAWSLGELLRLDREILAAAPSG